MALDGGDVIDGLSTGDSCSVCALAGGLGRDGLSLVWTEWWRGGGGMRRVETSSWEWLVPFLAGNGGGVPDGLEAFECRLPRDTWREFELPLGRGGGGGGGWCVGLRTGLTTVDRDSVDAVDAVDDESTLSDDADRSCSTECPPWTANPCLRGNGGGRAVGGVSSASVSKGLDSCMRGGEVLIGNECLGARWASTRAPANKRSSEETAAED